MCFKFRVSYLSRLGIHFAAPDDRNHSRTLIHAACFPHHRRDRLVPSYPPKALPSTPCGIIDRSGSSATTHSSGRIMSNVNSQPIPTLYVNNIESKVKKEGE